MQNAINTPAIAAAKAKADALKAARADNAATPQAKADKAAKARDTKADKAALAAKAKADKAAADKAAATAKAKAAKAASDKAAGATKAAPAPRVNAHLAAGLNGSLYRGLSPYTNSNRKPRIAIAGQSKYCRATPASLSERSLAAFNALRACYAAKPFAPRGFDNGILAMLCGAGLISPVAKTGATSDDNGTTFAIDGATPLQFALTKAGIAYGKATA